ncbi:MAG: transposase [Planctomycetes bacterium]|nr:transposase [Planctomycetota bacterium]
MRLRTAPYSPKTLFALLIYCYANGVFSSGRIEAATYRGVLVRHLTANTHPDHSTICAFRRAHGETVHATFHGKPYGTSLRRV